jgi:hypothetical protein
VTKGIVDQRSHPGITELEDDVLPFALDEPAGDEVKAFPGMTPAFRPWDVGEDFKLR